MSFGPRIFQTVIHKAQNIAAAAGQERPVVLWELQSRGAREYESLTDEVIARGSDQHYPEA